MFWYTRVVSFRTIGVFSYACFLVDYSSNVITMQTHASPLSHSHFVEELKKCQARQILLTIHHPSYDTEKGKIGCCVVVAGT